MVAFTDKSSVVAMAIVALLETNKDALGLDQVYYGDQLNLPNAKCAAVRVGRKTRERAGVAGPGGRMMNFMPIVINVYNSTVGDEGSQRLVVDQLAEAIEDLLHLDITVGGLTLDGFVSEFDPDPTFRTGSMYRMVQLTYTARSKTNLTP